MVVFTQSTFRFIFGEALGGSWSGATVRLFKNDYHPTPFSTIADFEECDFDGYARRVLTGSGFEQNTTSSGTNEFPTDQVWGSSPQTSDQVVFGFYLVSAVTADLVLAAGRFDNPVNVFPVPQFALRLNTVFQLGNFIVL